MDGWDAYLAKRNREGWGSARPPDEADYPGHEKIAEAARRRRTIQLAVKLSAENSNPRVHLPAAPKVAENMAADQHKREGFSRTPPSNRKAGRPRLTKEQQRESRHRRREKDRERKRRARRPPPPGKDN
jgi:hypothetical protein